VNPDSLLDPIVVVLIWRAVTISDKSIHMCNPAMSGVIVVDRMHTSLFGAYHSDKSVSYRCSIVDCTNPSQYSVNQSLSWAAHQSSSKPWSTISVANARTYAPGACGINCNS
jgi:hypothetical protein